MCSLLRRLKKNSLSERLQSLGLAELIMVIERLAAHPPA